MRTCCINSQCPAVKGCQQPPLNSEELFWTCRMHSHSLPLYIFLFSPLWKSLWERDAAHTGLAPARSQAVPKVGHWIPVYTMEEANNIVQLPPSLWLSLAQSPGEHILNWVLSLRFEWEEEGLCPSEWELHPGSSQTLGTWGPAQKNCDCAKRPQACARQGLILPSDRQEPTKDRWDRTWAEMWAACSWEPFKLCSYRSQQVHRASEQAAAGELWFPLC